MRALAGFPTKGGGYWLRRATVTPSDKLQRFVYPDVEDAAAKLAQSSTREIAGEAFVQMLRHMRVVFLQDSVIVRRKYPNHRLWKHDLFATTKYLEFDRELLAVMPTQPQPETQSIAAAVPQIAEVLKKEFGVLNGKLGALASGVNTLKTLTKKRLVLTWEDEENGPTVSSATLIGSSFPRPATPLPPPSTGYKLSNLNDC
ncbi:hypothetical protein P3T76_002011 [Phytophthora citrophthora]|uniref:Ndc10 domain-containing protein n=1 Tax=Phytophthora citrophthora TaxID=4793 RepID=A0AAD9GYK8_9STRA|nr:hypothetical protein P3T76_002011 [Phytophthora citrophthora]